MHACALHSQVAHYVAERGPLLRRHSCLSSSSTCCAHVLTLKGLQVLDAPLLQDDFYLNLVDWSSQNILAVGLGSSVYLWSAFTSKVLPAC